MPAKGGKPVQQARGLRSLGHGGGKYIAPHHPNHVKPSVGRKPMEYVPGHSASRGK